VLIVCVEVDWQIPPLVHFLRSPHDDVFAGMVHFPVQVKPQLELGLKQTHPEGNVVLVRYGPHHTVHREWVYNSADIDSQRVIWALELGPERDRALFDYYRGRTIWLFDDEQMRLTILRPPNVALSVIPTHEPQSTAPDRPVDYAF
jgi:hypothetical protein